MSTVATTGSPLQQPASGSRGLAQDENTSKFPEDTAMLGSQDTLSSLRKGVVTLTTSKFANHTGQKQSFDTASSPGMYPMDTLLAKLSEQHAALHEQTDGLNSAEEVANYNRNIDHQLTPKSFPVTAAEDGLNCPSSATTRLASAAPAETPIAAEELLRLRLELAHAQSKINRLDQELAHTRTANPEYSSIMPFISQDSDSPVTLSMEHGMSRVVGSLAPGSQVKQLYGRDNIWALSDESRSDAVNNSFSAGTVGQSRGMWRTDQKAFGFQQAYASVPGSATASNVAPAPTASVWPKGRTNSACFVDPSGQTYEHMATTDESQADRLTPDNDMLLRPASRRRINNRPENRLGTTQAFGVYGGFSATHGQYDSTVASAGGQIINASGLNMLPQYQQQPIGTPLSPHATEFNAENGPIWKPENSISDSQTFIPTTEPLNYRRLLDRNVNCNWKYIVDKIVCNNDQQASIFLQQKLKVGTADQKYDIVEAIVAQAYHLMINRFGNFLVQRCFEHGTMDQIIKIAMAIRGNTLSLSMDPFGCHVVQKAFDSVPEEYKAVMVHELLRRIPETVIHRYACHVWQKLFELRWNDSPPQIMKYVNDALRGMWHEVALGETGSLVVQNIFENCLEEDKRPCIDEVLGNIDVVAHGQFGNWCIQHICEHGSPGDRGRAVDHVIRFAAEYSTDQFASKVVEKCLKIGGAEFLGRYLDRVCEGRVDRPRIPLIDIASDQYGNYLIQYILTHASPQHREIVAAHIRKHMVSLRGSKFGSRVGMLCTNPAVATRPGPGVGPSVGRLPPRYGSGHPRHLMS